MAKKRKTVQQHVSVEQNPPTSLRSQCSKCGVQVCHRIHTGSVKWIGVTDSQRDAGSKTWGWTETSFCPSCEKVPCMVSGCRERGSGVLKHWFRIGESGTQFWKQLGVEIRNDLCLCPQHVRAIRIRRFVMKSGTIGFYAGCLLLLMSLSTTVFVFGIRGGVDVDRILGTCLFYLGALCHVAGRLLRMHDGFKKAGKFVATASPPQWIRDIYRWWGPWKDDGFEIESMGPPSQKSHELTLASYWAIIVVLVSSLLGWNFVGNLEAPANPPQQLAQQQPGAAPVAAPKQPAKTRIEDLGELIRDAAGRPFQFTLRTNTPPENLAEMLDSLKGLRILIFPGSNLQGADHLRLHADWYEMIESLPELRSLDVGDYWVESVPMVAALQKLPQLTAFRVGSNTRNQDNLGGAFLIGQRHFRS